MLKNFYLSYKYLGNSQQPTLFVFLPVFCVIEIVA